MTKGYRTATAVATENGAGVDADFAVDCAGLTPKTAPGALFI